MREEIAIAVGTVASNLMFDYCRPNQSLLVRALEFDADKLDNLSDQDLSKFIIVLGQYLVTLRYQQNVINVRRLEADKELVKETMQEIRSRMWKSGLTLKEKTSEVQATSENVQAKVKLFDIAESENAIVEGMYDSFLEYLNAYKKEQSRRVGEHSIRQRV